MKVVFVSGPYRGNVSENIRRAREVAIRLWKEGYAVICPHMNTAHFDGLADDSVWLAGDMEFLNRCDAIYMVPGWEQSEGARAELAEATRLGIERLDCQLALERNRQGRL